MKKNNKRYWGKQSELEEEEELSEILIKEPNFLEVVNNRIYFYSEVERDRILELNKQIRELNNDLIYQSKINSRDYKNEKIFLHINSYGGVIFSGLAAVDEILKSEVPVYTIVDGCAASAATLISVVGKHRLMNKHSFMLIHQLSSGMWGKYSEFEDEKKNLDLLMGTIKDIYLEHTKIPESKLNEILKHDLWFTAKECLEYKLVDEVI